MATELTIRRAMQILPHLIRRAQTKKTTTYGQLAGQIGVHHRVIRHSLGYIRDEICRKRGLPLLNCLVVNTDTQMPGDSFLPEETAAATADDKRRYFETFRDEAYEYPNWDELLSNLGLQPIRASVEELNAEARQYNDHLRRSGGTGEGPNHRRLKEYIAAHPDVIGLPAEARAYVEYPLPSGDECDIMFDLGDQSHAVAEIKNGLRGELVRGVYQAIKYRAVLAASLGLQEPAGVEAFLVAFTMPDDISEFGGRFGVRCMARMITDETNRRPEESHEE